MTRAYSVVGRAFNVSTAVVLTRSHTHVFRVNFVFKKKTRSVPRIIPSIVVWKRSSSYLGGFAFSAKPNNEQSVNQVRTVQVVQCIYIVGGAIVPGKIVYL